MSDMITAQYIKSNPITMLNGFLYFDKNLWKREPNNAQHEIEANSTSNKKNENNIKTELDL